MPSDSDSKKPPAGDPAESGSIDVGFSGPNLSAAPELIGPDDSAPMTTGGVKVAVSTREPTGPHSPGRSRRITGLVQGAASGAVEKLGSGIETIGEGVSKLGDATRKVPLVGAGVARLGEGITKAGESIHGLPRVAQTRRGRLLVRSVIVGFALVALWIVAIVGLQIHGNDTPDFRPAAEEILVKLSKGTTAIDEIYEHASPRFQEMVRKERFVDDMTDLDVTVGKFLELTAINDTLVTNGPTGRVGRVSLTASYQKGLCTGSISFHWDQGQWKLLGIGLELPPQLKVTREQREQRVAACADPMDLRKCEIHRVSDTILHQLHEEHAGEVWDAAADVFKKQETRTKFIELQHERRATLGAYKRILNVTEAKVISGTSATFDVLAEFEKSSGVRVVFTFERVAKADPWQLRSFKVALPMPRADDDKPIVTPADAGVPAPRTPAPPHH
ncbi:MAG: hypothetical protein JWO36_571 [Myxococcales bacterium]|nr:hypothetical protein [Myxococcales bacterium]